MTLQPGKHDVVVDYIRWLGCMDAIQASIIHGRVDRSDCEELVGQETAFTVFASYPLKGPRPVIGKVVAVETIAKYSARSGRDFFVTWLVEDGAGATRP